MSCLYVLKMVSLVLDVTFKTYNDGFTSFEKKKRVKTTPTLFVATTLEMFFTTLLCAEHALQIIVCFLRYSGPVACPIKSCGDTQYTRLDKHLSTAHHYKVCIFVSINFWVSTPSTASDDSMGRLSFIMATFKSFDDVFGSFMCQFKKIQ